MLIFTMSVPNVQAENLIDCNAPYNDQIDQILHYRPDPVVLKEKS